MFRQREGHNYKIRVVDSHGVSVTLSTGTSDRESAEGVAGLLAFLKSAGEQTLIDDLVAKRVKLCLLYDFFVKKLREKDVRRGVIEIGEGSVPQAVRDAIANFQGPRIGFVYAIRNTASGAIKIGYASDVKKRFSSLGVAHSEKLELLGWMPGNPALEWEIQAEFGEHRIRGEWFRPHRDIIAWTKELKNE